MTDIEVQVSVPSQETGVERQPLVLTLGENGTLTATVGYSEARLDFQVFADAFAVLRMVYSAELRTIMGHPARDVIGAPE